MRKPDETFRALHQPGKPFILANVWDAGSARLMAALGARALATSSAAYAFTLGRTDKGEVSRDEALAHGADIAKATDLPVSGDLENGYGRTPDDAAKTVRAAAVSGLAGCCIEDTALPDDHPYDFALSVERIAAAAEAARAAKSDFVLTARADGVMLGQYGLKEAIRRLNAYSDAGADVLYAPMPGGMDALAEICRSVDKPVNALCAGAFAKQNLEAFAAIGVARISLGSSLARVVHQTMISNAAAMFGHGDFAGLGSGASGDDVDDLLVRGERVRS